MSRILRVARVDTERKRVDTGRKRMDTCEKREDRESKEGGQRVAKIIKLVPL